MERNPSLDVDRNPSSSQDAPSPAQANPNPIYRAPDPGTPEYAEARHARPFRSLRKLARRTEGRSGDHVDALEADALLLREENARLRVKLEAPPNVGHVIERLRALPTPPSTPEGEHGPANQEHDEHAEQADEALHVLTEAIVMRNALLEVCGEIGQVMAGLEARLAALTPSGQLMDEGHTNPHRNGHLKEARR
ncbi:MAG TPA: hypothetical protein VFB51_16160 [Solirubrobacterales bacterium]|nr:hypothetical protein [Solirubrobacterales bacterium]